MYIIFGESIVDSEEIKSTIEENSDFNVDRDMCKGTKRNVKKAQPVRKRHRRLQRQMPRRN